MPGCFIAISLSVCLQFFWLTLPAQTTDSAGNELQDTMQAADSVHLDADTITQAVVDTGRAVVLPDTGFLHQIRAAPLAEELNRLKAVISKRQGDLDSTYQQAIPDTLRKHQLQVSATVTRLRGFRRTVEGYRQSVSETQSRLIPEGTTPNSSSPQVQHFVFRLKEKADSLNLILTETDDALQQADAVLEEFAGRMDQYAVIDSNRQTRYLWSAPQKFNRQELVRSFRANNQTGVTARYLIQSEWGRWSMLLLLSAGFFFWIHRNRRYMVQWVEKQREANPGEVKETAPVYSRNTELAHGVVFFLTLLPLFSPYLPSFVFQVIQLIIMIILLWMARKQLSRVKKYWWGGLLIVYVVVILTNNFMGDGFALRAAALVLNGASLLLAVYLRRNPVKGRLLIRVSNVVFLFFVSATVASALLNIFGNVVYARYLSIASMVGLVQYVVLIAFFRMMKDALALQFRVSGKSGGFFKRIEKVKAQAVLNRVLYLLGAALWLIVLVVNFNSAPAVFSSLSLILDKVHTVGSIHFTWGNVIAFVLIIGLANWFQKNVPLFFADPPGKDFNDAVAHAGSKIALLRLVIIVIGFLISVTALGISMDKLTIILGALSVGIGLGLQNIFNNFVSGIILIFEKPFRLGDYVELADKKGRVKEIGIRSSTLITQEGAEVIIPNGDLLSGRLVNWTLSSSYIKSSVVIQIRNAEDLTRVRHIIREEACSIDYVMKDSPVEVLYENVTADGVNLRVSCWIVSIYNEQVFKSKLLRSLHNRLTKEKMVMVTV